MAEQMHVMSRGAIGDFTKAAVQGTAQVAPPALEPYLKAAEPVLVFIGNTLDQLGPYFDTAGKLASTAWTKLQPYHPEEFLPAIVGLLLLFFGGSLPLTVAAIEAFRLCGWDRTKNSIIALYGQYKIAKAASDKDDLVDENKDGIADVKQLDKKQLLTRKIAIFMKSTDPAKVQDALQGLTAGITAVVATLRLQFAQTITLGTSLGDIFTNVADKALSPLLLKVVPREYHKWIPLCISYACRSFAISIAWWCQRVISAMHSATRGAQQLLLGIFHVLERNRVKVPYNVSPNHPLFGGVVFVLAVFGFYSQLARAFGFPFPLNIILIPLRFIEVVLAWTLAYGPK
mmetsp:Transcript_5037/g.10927  ORF Transcript_5037/g.10927 Transcript_5037/m.10927 type:complete len:344 (-) Transcript_5037:655-1686(-)|eukprot:CAMPEP_0202900630 /NCGR_PEP_ID=MMETSP1392-20130828/11949_1 /ASSEMBLY_ACC=CAM_ASM_000868 /TAXON_ID=225041 /ORGANISM="Chlamydomonas chlamydogama, Strain SAG 11-48b" /LENGTH=343 /DNA_ID=CAMNT_0049587063 /DNA_START=79 /DNA_END=1110 /DNA_ORIENTATION=-